jgi:hypothetical protein
MGEAVSNLHAFSIDVGDLAAQLRETGRQAPIILARALNRAQASGKTATVRAVAADTGLTRKYIEREIKVDKANRTQLRATVEIVGSRIPLIAFGARGPEPSRGRGRGVSYRLPTGRGRIREAFITAVEARRTHEMAAAFIGPALGHRGVFKRRTKRRFPITELRGPSIPHVFEKFLPVFRQAAGESLIKNLRSEISFAQTKQGAATLPAQE